MKTWRALLGMTLAAVTGAGAIVGCAHRTETRAARDVGMVAGNETERAIRGVLGPAGSGLTILEEKGIVSLAGEVPTLLAKQKAIELAGTVKGVEAVIDAIAVRPEKIDDVAIAARVKKRLASEPATVSKGFRIAINNGEVTLHGQGTYAERRLAGELAMGVPGVTRVDNEIRIAYPVRRSDAAIRADVLARLDSDVWLAKAPLHVTVTKGRVSLNGTVGTLYEKSRALLDGWVDGALGVSDEGLTVASREEPLLQKSGKSLARSDSRIATDLKRAFRYDPRVQGGDIRVRILDGGVTLNGRVASFRARRAAEEDAKNTVGVTGVRNLLNVLPSE